eukprot:405587_1
MGNTPIQSAQPEIQFDEPKLLVNGFLRKIHKTSTPPVDICQICYQFYFTSKLIFINNYAAFHAVDVTSPTNTQFHKNIFQLHSYNSNQLYFDISCYIPHISNSIHSSNLNQLLNSNKIKHHTKYDAILTRKVSNMSPQRAYNILYIFESNNIFKHSNTENDYFVLQSSFINTNHFIFDNWHYCGSYWGIIGVINQHIYRLKLQDIDGELNFTPYNITMHSGKWIMKYLDGKNALFAVQKHAPIYSYNSCNFSFPFKYSIYDLCENKWTKSQSIKCKTKWGQQHNFKWNLCYHENKMYLVSQIGDVMEYSFEKNKWNNTYETNPNDGDFMFNNAPIVWCYDQCCDLLYCAGTADDEVLQLRLLDMRRKRKQWVRCFDNVCIDLPLASWDKFNTFT